MKFGVFSLMQWPEDRSQSDVYRNELAQLSEAEAQGYDGIWLAEHHFSRYGIGPAIHLTAAHLAARTERIRIGTAITILPFMHPIRIAEEVAVLDHLSGGRIDFGMGRGYQRHEFDGFGVEIAKSHLIFKEQLEIIERAWTGERFAWDGEFFQFPEMQILPTPLQNPRPPLFVAALSNSTLEWAASAGYPVMSDQFSPGYRLAKMRALYQEHAEKAGVDTTGFELPMLRQVYVGESMAKAREDAAPALLWYYRSLARVGSPGGISGELPENYSTYNLFGEDGIDPEGDPEGLLEFLFENCTVVGDAAYCRDKLAELQETCGLDSLIAWQNFGGLAQEATRASQRRFIEDVAPAFG
ncbi:MAG: LLM class flavin-dependent oxidoreductase [Myxococcota bacterium]|jgi:alkanesulfonate monooxygenase SsuD/methylene tetrahydromethanopterin reductase-like flavin-dependent oxidoreductase (luciferase family)